MSPGAELIIGSSIGVALIAAGVQLIIHGLRNRPARGSHHAEARPVGTLEYWTDTGSMTGDPADDGPYTLFQKITFTDDSALSDDDWLTAIKTDGYNAFQFRTYVPVEIPPGDPDWGRRIAWEFMAWAAEQHSKLATWQNEMV